MHTTDLRALDLPRVHRAWYPVALAAQLGAGALVRTLYGVPLVLFRGADGEAVALLDRCPHRNVPLSLGWVEGGTLRCRYHGWRFDSRGRCCEIPALAGEAEAPARAATRYATREQQGLVWVWATPDEEPEGEPFAFPWADRPGYLTVVRVLEAPASMHAVAENALDVPHTAFLHRGLFRGAARNEIRARVRREADRVEARFLGESSPRGLAGWILSPSGGEVEHTDRFTLPSIVEVDYRLGPENHIALAAALCPEGDHLTRVYAVVSLRTRIPAWLLRPVVEPVALKIFAQDVEILGAQTAHLRRFGGSRFTSTEVDLLGPQILLLLGLAARGESAAPWEREVTLHV